MLNSPIKDIKAVAGIAPQVATATVLSAACDTQYFNGVKARVHIGTFGDSQSSSVYMEAELQDSDDNSTYAAVANALLAFPSTLAVRAGHAVGTFFQSKADAAADAAGLYEVSYLGNKRYLKINLRLTGTHTNGTPVAAGFELTNPTIAPAQ